MVRGGRGYGGSSGGRGRGSSYRGSSGSNFRPGGGSSRSSNYSSSTGAGGAGGSGGGSSSYHASGSRANYGSSSNYQYDSRSRDRFASSRHSDGRHDDHKRSHRASSSRDRSSPDRKRSRHEDSRMSSSYSSSSYRRNESQSSSRNRPTPPTAPISSRGAGSSSGGHYRSGHRNEDSSSSHRHSGNDSMGPPKSVPPRSRLTRSRGGGLSSGRFRGSTSSRGSVRIIRRRESSDVKLMRRKLLLARQRDRVRRIKIARLTSSLRKRRESALSRKSSSSTVRKSRSDKKDDDSKNEDGDDKKKDTTSVAEGDDDDDIENGENEKHSDENGEKKEFVIKKEIKKKKDASEERQSDEEKENVDKKITVKVEAIDDAEHDDKDKDDPISKTKSPSSRKIKSSYIKLICIHCRMKCLTFKEYNNHLYARIHRAAMKRLALKQKAQLSRMRMNQRNAQRDIEENSKDELEDCPPQFCPLCRLNYRQPKAKHQLSESHRKMKKFLMPYCNTCHIAFKSPMMYEAHRCSLDHIRRKADSNESRSEASGDEKEVDLNNFLTVDSIGEIDGHSGDEAPEDITEEEGKEKVNVGAEYVKKTEALYCDLCRLYFSIRDDEEITIKKHCATRSHLKAYLRHKEDQNLREEAERVQRSSRNKDSTKEKKKDSGAKDKSPVKIKEEVTEENEEEGDKLWDGVDKDLGDLLREVEPDGQEDDEEDGSVLNLNTERFDRFKNSEKKGINGTGGETEDDHEQDEDEKDSTLEDSSSSIKVNKGDDSKNDEEPIEAN